MASFSGRFDGRGVFSHPSLLASQRGHVVREGMFCMGRFMTSGTMMSWAILGPWVWGQGTGAQEETRRQLILDDVAMPRTFLPETHIRLWGASSIEPSLPVPAFLSTWDNMSCLLLKPFWVVLSATFSGRPHRPVTYLDVNVCSKMLSQCFPGLFPGESTWHFVFRMTQAYIPQ